MQQSLQLTSNHLSEEEYCLFSSLLPLSQLTDVIQATLFGCLRSAVPNICNENVSPKVSPKNKTEIRKIDTLTRQQKLFLMRSQGNVGTLKGPHEPVNHSWSHVAFLHTSFSCSLNSIKAVCVCVYCIHMQTIFHPASQRCSPVVALTASQPSLSSYRKTFNFSGGFSNCLFWSFRSIVQGVYKIPLWPESPPPYGAPQHCYVLIGSFDKCQFPSRVMEGVG